ncbi:carbohydrate ABC transporter permease [Jiangella alba]|uniref:Carbohydrate ABC transporter membrane protein 1, CUT1 family n=1 Tax=Jiangella alba TaxID=561176 RepID=A0A1H5CRR6_9ACTN|nr:sugar ABC transporter permease [Jiangella alba]SED69316.1 carbohydrate ABC transporter membrane protein 1, CUT1 family [Jiangella alba]
MTSAAAPAAVRTRTRAAEPPRRPGARRRSLRGYWLVLPALALYAAFLLWPIGQTVWLSLTDWNGLTASPTWTGLDNYRRLIGDERFFGSLGNNLVWVAGSWLAQGLGLLLAAILSASWIRGRTLYRTLLFVPATMALVIVGIAWDQIYRPETGLLNVALEHAGLESLTRGWLSESGTAMGAVIATANWTYYGFAMVILLGGLQNIDPHLYEAAALDGANARQRFRHVTVPALRNHITLLVVVSFINTLKTFDLVYVMTNGGPGHSTEVVAYYIYALAFVTHRVGYAAAAAVVLTVIILVITVIFLRVRERERP